MPNYHRKMVRLATALGKYYIEKGLGESATSILGKELTSILGESVIDTVSQYLDQGEQAEKLLEAFEHADDCFGRNIGDDYLQQAIISLPFAGLEQLDEISQQIPITLDDSKLLIVLRNRFEQDWPGKFTDQQLDQAALVYRDCLDKALAIKLDQMLPTMYRKIDRIDQATRDLQGGHLAISRNLKRIEDILSSQTNELFIKMGITTQLAIQSVQPLLSDGIPQPPSIYLNRNELINDFQESLKVFTWLALIDGPGKGKTQLAASVYLLHGDSKRKWISLRNKNDLALKHIRDQLVLWLIQLTKEHSIWEEYIFGGIAFSEIVSAVAKNIGSDGILVVDDLPDPTTSEDLFADLETIAREFANHSSKLVTTSQRDLPPSFGINLPSIISPRSCENFSPDEVLALLHQTQIPKELQTMKFANWISATTKGHPSLVMATIQWLQQQDSSDSISTYDRLIAGEPLQETLDYNRKLLLQLLDSSSKELLYRLSLIGEQFDRTLANNIANIPPTINNPGEVFDNLIGPWLERSSNEMFEVSPLLVNSGQDNLPFITQEKIHLQAVEQYLKERRIGISKAHFILTHLWQAQDYVRFASILIQLLLSTQTQEQAKNLDWTSQLFIDVTWPIEINLGLRIMVRAAQVRNLALAGGNYKIINEDLESLISQTDIEKDALAILFAYSNAGLLSEDLPVEITIPRSFGTIQLINSSKILEKLLGEELQEHLPNTIWSQGMRVKSWDEIKLFVENFSNLSKTDRGNLAKSSFATEVSSHLIDQSWYSEGAKPVAEQDWSSVLDFLDELSKYPWVHEYECFQLAIARSRAVVYADYLKQPNEALELLEPHSESIDPNTRFLANYTMGCFSSNAEMTEKAHKLFSDAEVINGDSFPFYRLENTKRLAIEKSKLTKWDSAQTLFIDVIHSFRRSEGKELFIWECYEVFGELAYIHWSKGNLAKSCAAMYGLVIGLINEEDIEDRRYIEAFNKTGHGLGWFVSILNFGSPAPALLNGGEYTPVQAGFFGIRRESLGDFEHRVGLSKARLLTQLAMFAYSSGLVRMSWHLNKMSLQYYRFENNIDNMMLLPIYSDLTNLESFLGDPIEALKYGLETREFLALGVTISRTNIQLNPGDELRKEDILPDVLEEDYQIGEKQLFYVLFGPIFTYLMGEIPTLIDISELLERWDDAITQYQEDLIFAKEWKQVIQYYSELFQHWKDGREINIEFEVFDEKTTFEIFRYLLNSDKPNFSLEEAFSYHISAISTLPQYGRYAKYMLYGLGRFIHRYWLNIAKTRRFALRNPDQFLEGLKSISPNGRGVTLAQTLIYASQALGINIPSETREILNQVKDL